MKKWIILEVVIVAAIVFLSWQIKTELTPVAQAQVIQEDDFELLVQTQTGLVPYSQVKIVEVEVVVEEAQDVPELVFSHQEDIQKKIMQIEPELGETLIKLAHCESSLNPLAVGDNGNSHGLYQIFLKWHPDVSLSQAQDIEFATKWTADKIRQGQGDLWTCWDKI